MNKSHIADATLAETIAFFEKKLGIMQTVVNDDLEAESGANAPVCEHEDLIKEIASKSKSKKVIYGKLHK